MITNYFNCAPQKFLTLPREGVDDISLRVDGRYRPMFLKKIDDEEMSCGNGVSEVWFFIQMARFARFVDAPPAIAQINNTFVRDFTFCEGECSLVGMFVIFKRSRKSIRIKRGYPVFPDFCGDGIGHTMD